jgi:hypothetical protein
MSISKENQDKLITVMKEMYEIEEKEITKEATDTRILSCNGRVHSILSYNNTIDSKVKFSAILTDDYIDIKNWITEEKVTDFIEYIDYFNDIFDNFNVPLINFSDGYHWYKFTKDELWMQVMIYNALHKGNYDNIDMMLDKINDIGVKEIFLDKNVENN